MLAKLLIWILAGKEFEIFFVAQKKAHATLEAQANSLLLFCLATFLHLHQMRARVFCYCLRMYSSIMNENK